MLIVNQLGVKKWRKVVRIIQNWLIWEGKGRELLLNYCYGIVFEKENFCVQMLFIVLLFINLQEL